MAAVTNLVNLDALIQRADLAAPGEMGEDISAMSIMGLEPRGLLYPALRKPDFQRETSNWTPDQVADLIATFVRRDLIPAVILWRAGTNVFVIDGAHRLSALIAWVHNDYGDGEVSRRFFQNSIPEEQLRAAARARELIKVAIGSYEDHKIALDFPNNSRPDVVERAARIGWVDIPAQWIRNADHEKAEKAFFRINQGGMKIDAVERRILSSRNSATAISARAILRGGTGHNYWKSFTPEVRADIENLGREVRGLLFEPPISLPIKTLDLPVGGSGYGAKVLPFVFDLVTVVNNVAVKDSSNKRSNLEDDLPADGDGTQTVEYLSRVRDLLRRICSTHPSSLGLHPALYFYGRSGAFQPTALLTFAAMFGGWNTDKYIKFTRNRAAFEEFISGNGAITEAVRRLGSGARSRPRLISLYSKVIDGLANSQRLETLVQQLADDPSYSFLINPAQDDFLLADDAPSSFTRDQKGAAFIRDALATAPKCPTCGGLMHRNGMQVGHIKARREGGLANIENAYMQHPFCNSTYAN